MSALMTIITNKFFANFPQTSMKFTHFFITFLLLTFSTQAISYQVSQAQIEQCKKLPASQQQALAKSMGIDINAINGQLSGNGNESELTENSQRYPRGTQFDQEGNPFQGSNAINSNEQEEN